MAAGPPARPACPTRLPRLPRLPILPAMPSLSAVYRRTSAGQHAAINRPDLLPEDQRRMLLLLNGITPLDALLAHGAPLSQAQATLQWLLDRGLVEPAPQE